MAPFGTPRTSRSDEHSWALYESGTSGVGDDERRSSLIHGFLHDIKTHSGSIRGLASLLLDGVHGELTDAQRRDVELILRTVQTVEELARDVLEVHRAESGRLPIRRTPVDLEAVAAEAVRDCRIRAEQKGLDLRLTSDGEFSVETDGRRVRQILANLLSNAVKYTDTGGVEVWLDAETEGPGEDAWAVLAVRDTGPGLTERDRERIFQEFTRVGPADVPGTGLGLAISRRLARLLGGDLTVESEPGIGSTFILRLPLGSGRPT